jgi:hypothetical protein
MEDEDSSAADLNYNRLHTFFRLQQKFTIEITSQVHGSNAYGGIQDVDFAFGKVFMDLLNAKLTELNLPVAYIYNPTQNGILLFVLQSSNEILNAINSVVDTVENFGNFSHHIIK